MKTVGIIGWRGMVGSVLLERFRQENDLEGVDVHFFSTSQAGQPGPDLGGGAPLLDANSVDQLAQMDILISCQGGDYTKEIHPQLRASGWEGAWIDAASSLRMMPDSCVILDPVNRPLIDQALQDGIRDFIGGNCTVSLMLMALQGLFDAGYVQWVSSSTYQSASGAGARNMIELCKQFQDLGNAAAAQPAATALELDRSLQQRLQDPSFPQEAFGAPLAASLIPWIDRAMPGGQTREEWKGMAECNRIIGREENPVPVDGTCVRVGSMRCHAQAFTIKLTRNVHLDEAEALMRDANDWVELIPNEKEDTLQRLSPAAVSGGLTIPIGRLRSSLLEPNMLHAFSLGDQLLWGAAEPLRRMLLILLERI